MCLAIPGKIIALKDNVAIVEIGDVQRETSTFLLPDARINDYVLLHAGYAIQKIDEEEAAKTLDILRQMGEFYDSQTDDEFDSIKK